MGAFENMMNDILGGDTEPPPHAQRAGKGKRRPLDDRDYESFEQASNERIRTPPKNIDEIRTALKRVNPIKWIQIQGDVRWVKRQLKRMGEDPELAREIICR